MANLQKQFENNKNNLNFIQNDLLRKKRLRCSYSEGADSLSDLQTLPRYFDIEINKNRERKRIKTLYKNLQHLIFHECEESQKFFLLNGLQDLYYSFCNLQEKLEDLELLESEIFCFDVNEDLNDISESLNGLYNLLSLNSLAVDEFHSNKQHSELLEESRLLKNKISALKKENTTLIQTIDLLQQELNEFESLSSNQACIPDKIRTRVGLSDNSDEQIWNNIRDNEDSNTQLTNSINLLQNKITQQEIVNSELDGLTNLLRHKIVLQERVISKLIRGNDSFEEEAS